MILNHHARIIPEDQADPRLTRLIAGVPDNRRNHGAEFCDGQGFRWTDDDNLLAYVTDAGCGGDQAPVLKPEIRSR